MSVALSAPSPKAKVDVLELFQSVSTKIEIPIIPWENKSFARISYQLYNTEKDLEKLKYALKKLIKQF